jgi:putative spermidine/putrescine transport system ATP-binding protein
VSTGTPFLEVVELRKEYSTTSSVGPVSFTIETGEFISLLGPSGCGKTTTLRCIAGFTEPSSGDIRVQGRSVLATPPHRRDFGLVFQNYALFPHLSVFENIAFGLRLRRRPSAELKLRVAEALDLVGLSGLEKRFPGEISGGQQQRVALARSLVLRPKLLLLDEPLSNLDAKLRVQMRTEIRALQRRLAIATIYVTHDQTEALALSDRIAVMNRGVVCQIASPREVYDTPLTSFVADFIGSSNLLHGHASPARDGCGSVVTVNGLTLRSDEPTPPATPGGAEVIVLIRPERIRVGNGGAQHAVVGVSPNIIHARVTDVVYLGEELQLRLEVDGVTTLTVTTESTLSREPRVGDAVDLTVFPRDVHLIAADAGQDASG